MRPASRSTLIAWFGIGLGLLAVSMLLALMLGAFPIGFDEIVGWITGSTSAGPDPVGARVLSSIRLPRAMSALAVGGALGAVGVVLQGTYRTPLADAHLLGYSSAAGAGAAAGFAVTPVGAWPILPVSFAVVACIAFGVVTSMLRSRAGGDRFILAGVAFGFALLAWTGLFVLIVDSPRVPTLMFFIFGSLAGSTWKILLVASVVLIPSVGVMWRYGPGLDLLVLGDREASALGFDTRRIVPIVVAAAGAAVAAAVVLGGVIGFVGLVVPFVLRPIVGPVHRILIPAAAIGGAIVVIAADTFARTVIAPSEIPVGLVTAAVGGPLFGWLLVRRNAG